MLEYIQALYFEISKTEKTVSIFKVNTYQKFSMLKIHDTSKQAEGF